MTLSKCLLTGIASLIPLFLFAEMKDEFIIRPLDVTYSTKDYPENGIEGSIVYKSVQVFPISCISLGIRIKNTTNIDLELRNFLDLMVVHGYKTDESDLRFLRNLRLVSNISSHHKQPDRPFEVSHVTLKTGKKTKSLDIQTTDAKLLWNLPAGAELEVEIVISKVKRNTEQIPQKLPQGTYYVIIAIPLKFNAQAWEAMLRDNGFSVAVE